ncbi:hypothetical protein H5410_042629 [Solanum commersonii]|uniref:Uncharacterized protein n=1 Tax=Solanum commersonii TaxID=4109 RepID=A0A9J5XUW2_SOLCO|nr:hypothetical protein H5410_042629 [Solanum commersonii]
MEEKLNRKKKNIVEEANKLFQDSFGVGYKNTISQTLGYKGGSTKAVAFDPRHVSAEASYNVITNIIWDILAQKLPSLEKMNSEIRLTHPISNEKE